MDQLNLNNIYSEFIEITSLAKNYNFEQKEDLNKIEIEFSIPIYDKALIKKLIEFKYFEILISNSSYSLDYYLDSKTKEIKEQEIDFLKERKFRIRFEKVYINEKIQELNLIGLFFDSKFLFQYLKTTNQVLSNKKLNIALYETECFNTLLLNLYNVNNLNFPRINDDYISENVIESLNLLTQYTNLENNNYDNIFAYIPSEIINNDINNDFSKCIGLNFYMHFLKIFSYKSNISSDYFNIRGKKSILIRCNGFYDQTNFNSYKSIVMFLLTGDKFLEKYIIIKDVITRYLDNDCTFNQLDNKIVDIEKTIKHYFHKYINEDIDEFFINRDSIYKEAIAMSKSINDQIDKVIAYINSTLISIIALAITFAFKNFSKLDSDFILTTFSILGIFSIYFYNTIKENSDSRIKSVENQFDLFIKRIGVIHVDEQTEIKEKFISNPRKDLYKALSKIKFLLIIINAILLSLLLFSLFEPIIISPTTK